MKFHKFIPFIQSLKFFIYLLITLNFVVNTNENDPNCANCIVNEETNFRCILNTECTDECKCSDNCRPNLYKDNKCYDCTDKFPTRPYKSLYTIKNGQCQSITSISECKKITLENNECVENCDPDYYELGDYCSSSCPDNIGMELDQYTNECICKKDENNNKRYIIEELINNKKYLRCTKTCPSGYHNSISCVENCDGQKITPDKECTNSCINNGYFLYKKNENINGVNKVIEYCVSSCPDTKIFYYDTNIPEVEKECREDCTITGNYYYSYNSNKCLTECNKMIIVDEEKKYCTNIGITDNYVCGDTGFPYQYGQYCLKDCHYTQTLDGKTTYFLIIKNSDEISKRICSEDCKVGDNLLFIDQNTLSCCNNCSETSNKFFQGRNCLSSCPSNAPNHMIYTKECVSECKENYILSINEKICYEKCPDNSQYKYIDKNNYCNTCKIPEIGIQNGVGYIFKKEEASGETKLYCYESCEEEDVEGEKTVKKYYHKYNDNECIISTDDYSCENNPDEYKYYIGKEEEKDYICYKSCKDISGEYIHQYKYRCYKEKVSTEGGSAQEPLFSDEYYIESGIYIYKEKNVAQKDFCSQIGYYYKIKNYDDNKKECVKDCGDDYRVEYESDEFGNIKTLGQCYEICPTDSTSDNNYPYYLTDEKKCYKECPYKIKLKINGVDSNGNILSIPLPEGEICVKDCPFLYSYESLDGKYCYDNCPKKFYIETNGKKVCVDDCGDKFYFDGEFKCIDRCEKYINGETKYYYYKDDKKCIDSCNIDETDSDTSMNYAFEAKDYPQKCLNKCPEGYRYYENEKLCIKNCNDNDYFYINDQKCLHSCGNEKYIINGNICSTNCTNEEPFFYLLYYGNDKMFKCTYNCEENGMLIFQKDTTKGLYECLSTCSKALYNHECRESCPEGLYLENNECKIECLSYQYHKKDENGVYQCKGLCDSGDFITSNKECVKYCPNGENYIGSGKQCKSFCSLEDGEYYYRIEITDDEITYPIYQCVGKCSDITSYYGLDDSKECVKSCPTEKTYYKCEEEKMCYSLCLNSKSNKYLFSVAQEFSASNPQINECKERCPDAAPNYGEDKICINGCNNLVINKIINKKDNSCVSKCDKYSNNRYLYIDDSNANNFQEYCVSSCITEAGQKKKYLINNLTCVENCIKPYNFLINGEICNDKCDAGQFANFVSGEEYECKSTFDSNLFYYEDEKIYHENCGNDYNIENTNICVKNCTAKSSNTKKYYFYEYEAPQGETELTPSFQRNTCVEKCPDDKPIRDVNNHCYTECKTLGYKYYIPTENICLKTCPENQNYKKNGYQCVKDCPPNKFLIEDDKCVDSCEESELGYKYYYSSDNICIKECKKTSDFININECVTSCPNYINGHTCVDYCPEEKKYFIGKFEHGETDLNNFCSYDCPTDYPFYQIENVPDGIEENKRPRKCIGSCPNYYITDKDPNIIGKKCVENCPIEYEYFYEHNTTHKECFESCPTNKKYYIKSIDLSLKPSQCYEECPSTNPYHNIFPHECLIECENGYATFKDRLCLSSCPIGSFWIKEKSPNNKEIIICVDDCKKVENARFATPERECVSECDENKFFRGNIQKGICECMNLFYYAENGTLICFDNTKINKCGQENTDAEEYKIQIYNSNQCIKNCNGVLSPSENICYVNGENCPKNSEKGIYNGVIKCECKYKYYINTNNEKICLDETEQCPEEYSFIILNENKCVSICDKEKYKIFDVICIEKGASCPAGMIGDDNTCNCYRYWYKTPENKIECLKNNENCTYNYPYLIEDTKECVKKCNKKNYDIFYDNKCISSCDSNMVNADVEPDNPLYSIATKTCRCANVWAEGICSTNSEDTCKELNINNLNFQVKATKECVEKCPTYYKYYFNNECFESCENAKNVYGYNVKKESDDSNKCICEKYYRIEEDKKIVCLDKCDENNEIEIESTKECVNKPENLDNFKCPYTSPYLYNNKCYNSCPDNTSIDTVKGNACICNNFWFKQEESDLITCLSRDLKCPYNTFPYYINTTKECIKNEQECIDNGYDKIFNYICYYKQCPYLKIIDEENNNHCICDQKYFWYKYKDKEDYREYLVCDLQNCPDDKPYIDGTNECINKCGDMDLYDYSNICYKECPLFTQKNEIAHICEFSTESNNLKELVGNVTNRIVDIYPSLPKGGLVISNDDASLQIYGINKDNNNNVTDSIRRTNLAYINLTGCIKKIYESNDIENIEDIVVVKLDLKSKNKKLAINPIEYEFINSKTGKILDATVCEKNQFVISYPLTYMLNSQKKRNLNDEENTEDDNNEEEIKKKDIMDKFNKGKILYEKDKSIDTFNFNNSIYSDICKSIEFDGKDLVLENRIQSLYPNYSFCESMCTYDYTDFIGERIYCNCTIKTSLDIDRPQEVKIYQLSKKELDNNQKGPTNIPILKCLLKVKITNNGGFYYSIILTLVEIILLFIVLFYAYKALVYKIRKKVMGENDNENINENKNNSNNDIENKNEEKKSIEYFNSENNRLNKNRIDKNSKFKNVISDSNTKRKMNKEETRIYPNPPKQNIEKSDEKEDEKGENELNNKKIKIKADSKTKNKHHKHIDIKIDEKNKFDIFSAQNENENNLDKIKIEKYLEKNEIEPTKEFFQSMKEEKKLLTSKYNHSLTKDKFDSIIIVSTSIFDKIYLIKILLLSGKYDIIPLMFSLYLLCHMLLLTLVTFFYDINTIKNIWQKENYPNTNYYLLYGFLSNIIVWIIFKIFSCLLDNKNKVKKINNANNIKKGQKYNKIISQIKRNMIIYFVLQFLIIIFCSFYLVAFCGIYIGTKKNIFQSYGIAFIEIIIIKIVYGFILGVLRNISLSKEIKILYNIVLILNKYIS